EKNKIGKDNNQLFFLSHCTAGTELSANQDEETEHETFQMEMEQDSQRFAFRTFSGKYWVLGPGGIQASISQPNKDSWFDMEWHGRQVALKAPNGKYVAPRKNGQLAAQADIAGEVEKFVLKIINRPLLVLRGEYGFMGVRKGSPALDGNRSSHDVFQLHFADGAYTIQDGAGRSWVVDDQGAVSLGPDGTPFLLQLCNNGRLALQAPNGRYVGSDQAGRVTANGEEPTGANTWEF
uniref:Fascin-like domain-containing protein n=1 Tax=Eptatretus burgeri TaxID=7764 RepID=A0A8C4QQS0_EPTBU